MDISSKGLESPLEHYGLLFFKSCVTLRNDATSCFFSIFVCSTLNLFLSVISQKMRSPTFTCYSNSMLEVLCLPYPKMDTND